MPQPENNREPARCWLNTAVLLTLATALVYAAGWTYAFHYFWYFRVGLLTLNIPAEYYFMYGFWVFRDTWWLALLYLLLALLLPWMLATSCGRTYLLPYRTMGIRLLPIVALLLFIGVYYLGMVTASRHYQQQSAADFPAYPPVRVWLKPVQSDNKILQALSQALPQGCHRLLLQNSDTLFLFQPPSTNLTVARLSLVQVARAEVTALRVLPQLSGCGG